MLPLFCKNTSDFQQIYRFLCYHKRGVIVMDIQIMVVEDDEHICETLKSFLMNEGYFVDTARDV